MSFNGGNVLSMDERFKQTTLGRFGLGFIYKQYLFWKLRNYGKESLTFHQHWLCTGQMPPPPPPPELSPSELKELCRLRTNWSKQEKEMMFESARQRALTPEEIAKKAYEKF